MCVEPWRIDFLILRPAAPRQHHGKLFGIAKTGKPLQFRHLPAVIPDLRHSVKAGVSCNINLRDAYSLQKMTALLCLYKYPGEPSQPLAVPCRFLAEKPLVGTERRAHKIDRNMATVQTVQIVAPYLILDKHSDLGMCQPQETAHPQRSVEGKITDTIGSGPIFAHLVARRGIESEQNLVLRMLATHHLNQRTSLLEFAEGCRMNPENLVAGCE